MSDLPSASSLKSALAPTPSQVKPTINGLSQLLTQRLPSTPYISPSTCIDASKDTDHVPPPTAITRSAAVASSRPWPPSSAPNGERGSAVQGGGHFAQFSSQDFEPDSTAPFADQWERLRASQGWVPGSQVYRLERARALRNELRACYFPSPSAKIKVEEEGEEPEDAVKEEKVGADVDGAGVPVAAKKEEDGEQEEDSKALSEAEAELLGFQAMCTAVGKQPGDTLNQCKEALRATLVNIVDLIDAHRMGTAVHVWTDFDRFSKYTMRDDKMMPRDEAKRDKLLKCFLKKLGVHGGRFGNRGGRKRPRTGQFSFGSGLDGERERKRVEIDGFTWGGRGV